MSLKQQILGKPDTKIVSVEVPDWGMAINVRSFSGHDRAKLMHLKAEAENDPAKMAQLNVHFVILAVCDDNGTPIFNDKDFEALSNKSATALDTITEAALKLNGLAPDSVDDKKKD